jgi:hypothetical protein
VEDRPLVAGFLIRALRPEGPFFCLSVNGEQGTGKSTATRVLRSLVDPSTAMLRPPPKDERDFLAGAVNNWCIAYDNLSGMQAWLSDALCRILTGGSFASRTLYSTAEETVIPLVRPAILNGIDDLLTRPDLADRAIALNLEVIGEGSRMDERAMRSEFDAVKGQIFGVLMDGLSSALRNIDHVRLPYSPRMIDAAKWATAAEEGMGLPSGSFISAYRQNQRDMVVMSIEASPFASAILDMVSDLKHWSGSSSELLKILQDYARDEESIKSKAWPKTPTWVGRFLNRLAPALRKAGIGVDMSRDTSGRQIKLSAEGGFHDGKSSNLNSTWSGGRKKNSDKEQGQQQDFPKNSVISVIASSKSAFHDTNDTNDTKIPKFQSEPEMWKAEI